MVDGIWNIPVPRDGAVVTPDVVLGPLVGFDEAAIGSAMAVAISTAPWRRSNRDRSRSASAMNFRELDTIYPQPFDQRFDVIVTEASVRR